MSKELHKKLSVIQQSLKAPKGQRNSFGNYNYRSAEDILEAVKPLLGELTLTTDEELIMLGERFYVKSTAVLSDGENEIRRSAFAREALTKKGMDESQITGACGSYAKKYSLNALLAIDDTKDSDTTNKHGKTDNAKKVTKTPTAKPVEKPVARRNRNAEQPVETPVEQPKEPVQETPVENGEPTKRRRRK